MSFILKAKVLNSLDQVNKYKFMYIPKLFKEEDQNTLVSIMQQNAFATIVTIDEKGRPIATSLPFLIKRQNEKIILEAHFAKNNPQWRHLENNQQVLVIFNGPHCYISPSWYKNAGVPTWDYVTVHAYGSATLFKSDQQIAELIEALSDKYEENQEYPWQAKGRYPTKMLNAIVGFEINVQELQGKVKIGQNKTQNDLKGVLNTLEKSSSEQELAIANLIKTYLKSKD